jgi:hypothetical protein
MKKMLILLLAVTSFSSFANSNKCENLMGTYSCQYDNSKIQLKITPDGENTIELSISSEFDRYVLNGRPYKSMVDNSTNTAECKPRKNQIEIENNSQGVIQKTIITLTKNGVDFSLNKPNRNLLLNCNRI